MHSPKLSQLSSSSRQVIKPNKEETIHKVIRISLLIWAFPRLAVSLLWTGVITLGTVAHLLSPYSHVPPSRLVFDAFAIPIQLLEIAMLTIFIVAGFKKSVKFYLIYYRYCILSLIIYVIATTLCLSLDEKYGHFFGDIYIFFSYFDVAGVHGNEYLIFFTASVINVGLEMLLIFLIKLLIEHYQSYGNNYTASESV
ncbi:hypothetical protein PYW08_011598 [Mythimna loreyi]|uniref:Uncharacterized protein n=1 Tax=Mythimna loreyi TaxID=667449 RepID=A0ACC2QKV8_9NEOP|nr:hypothetical protein PYW08_011598 [Mythimna loreyi]